MSISPTTFTKDNYQLKVHFSEYLMTEMKPEEDEESTETTQPETKQAE